ncbi:TATA box-binding protein-associated factor RNA polymerase I subunit D isoform X1 [Ahaetulla prasina]|uniref:TATA box-binding protein-associated factor RNA polymerase I subunit D isoform X1 n=1 Tax=Ahaetulla prasina TaxID=499056 RepID=UPI00264980EF|nr:TATA box-binding protein-associated factor RNA polymerase I subunit D isoform X1 [Ahaetulla prasina]XP_058041847.1 TATA box-binding protein-associated factor RNA polymerase I subunit D isoform X1 [Ahaetulla prasina]XP_058041848.1 TATA box-binding protein-associated factor RNA polymerase I subunit D isoform X1 [Ahaetulla prasina]
MTGAQKGFVALLQKSLGRKLLTFHCVLHQTFPLECTEVMNLVLQIVSTITAKGTVGSVCYWTRWWKARILISCCTTKSRWLSRGEVLKRFAACLEEVKIFLGSERLTSPELEQPEWLEKLHFMVDMTANLNTLNATLQEKGGTALHLLKTVLAFEHKLTVFARDLQRGSLSRFPSLREFKRAHSTINSEYLQSAVAAMRTSFAKQFREFSPVTPLTFDPSLLNMTAFEGVSQPVLDMELADIADKEIWMSKFKCLAADLEDVALQKAIRVQNNKGSDTENLPKLNKLTFDTWTAIPNTSINMKKYTFGVLSIFGSTYICAQVFSNMNDIKSKHRSHFTDNSLQSCVRVKVMSYSPEVQIVC